MLVKNWGVSGETISNNGEFLIDYEIELALPVGLSYFEFSGADSEVGKQFIVSGGHYVKQKVVTNAVQALPLANSWVNFSVVYGSVRAIKTENNLVFLEGMIKNGVNASGTVIATLPVGFRPLNTHSVMCGSSDGSNFIVSRLEIDNLGNITIRGLVDNAFLVLDGIKFLAGT